MIGKKNAKGIARKLILIPTKQQFNKLPPIPQSQPIPSTPPQPLPCQQIIIPKIQIVPSLHTPKQTHLQRSYIKSLLPKKFLSRTNYELDEQDTRFREYQLPFLKQEMFGQIIAQFQMWDAKGKNVEGCYRKILGKFGVVKLCQQYLREKDEEEGGRGEDWWQEDHGEEEDKHCKQWIQQKMRKIYVYWRNKRSILRSPILRKYWHKSETGPFKQRQQQGLQLRNRIKLEPHTIKQILKQDILELKKIIQKMRTRQQLQLKLISRQQSIFENNCKIVIDFMRKLNGGKVRGSSVESEGGQSDTCSIGAHRKCKKNKNVSGSKSKSKGKNKRSKDKNQTKKKSKSKVSEDC